MKIKKITIKLNIYFRMSIIEYYALWNNNLCGFDILLILF